MIGCLALHRADGGEAWGAQQVEDQEAVTGQLGHGDEVQDAEDADDFFLCHKAHDGRDCGTGIVKAKRSKDELDGIAKTADKAVVQFHLKVEHELAVHDAKDGAEPHHDVC